MRKLSMMLAAGIALSVAAAGAQAQQSRPETAQPEADRAAQGIAPATLSPTQIRQIQQALQDQGFSPGAVDGVWRAGSAAALRRYRAVRPGFEGSTANATADRIDRETLSALGLDPAQFGQAEPYAPSGPTGRRGSAAPPPRTAPGAPPSSSPGGTTPQTGRGTSPGSR